MLLEFSRGKSFVVAVFIVESFAKESSDGRGTSLHFCRPREIPWRNEREREREERRISENIFLRFNYKFIIRRFRA